MRMRVQLEVEVDVEQEILKENGEEMSDEQIANCVSAFIPSESTLSWLDDPIEVLGTEVLGFHRVVHQKIT